MEHLLHLLSLSSSAGGVLNLSALVLGLAALAFSLRALLRALAGRSIAGSLAIGGGACGAALPGLTRSRRQQPLDGQRNLAVRCNVDDLHLYCIAIVQHGVDILHELVGYLGNVDHADTSLRQRNKCAKGLYTGHAAFEYVPYLNCQNSILLVFQNS